MNKIALIGYRTPAIQAALEMGLDIVIWSNQAIPQSRTQFSYPVHVEEFPRIGENLSEATLKFFEQHQPIDAYVALTEASVLPRALLQQQFQSLDSVKSTIACHDKFQMKQLAKANDIAVTPFMLLDECNPNEVFQQWDSDIYVKPRCSSGSRNLHIATDVFTLQKLQGQNLLIEKAIKGIEMSVEFFVQHGKIIFMNLTQYYTVLEINILPGPHSLVDQHALRELMEEVVDVYQLDNLLVHLEFFVTPKGIVMGEFAIRPPGGYLMEAIEQAYGFNPWQALYAIKLGLTPAINQKAQQHVASWVYHPGDGKIIAIHGLEALKKLPSFQYIDVKKEIGHDITVRLGTGQDVAKLFFANKHYEDLVHDVEIARKVFYVELSP